MIKIVNGDLLKSNLTVIGHQTNCLGVMGAGIAKSIKIKWPEVFASYRKLCKEAKGRELLGTYQLVSTADHRYVANIFGEYSYTESVAPYEGNRHTDYDSLQNALLTLKEDLESKGITELGIPYKLGCGLAGGDWDGVVYPMLEEIFNDESFTLFIYKLQ